MAGGFRIVIEGDRAPLGVREVCDLVVVLVRVLKHLLPDIRLRLERDDR